MNLRAWNLLPILALAVLSTGCLGIFSGGGGGGEKSEVSFVVYNDLQPAAKVTVRLRTGERDVADLGSVPPGEERTLTWSADGFPDRYRLVAEQPSGAASISREFTLFDGAQARWQLRSNNLSVYQYQ